jgi:uncharacterized SAM-binding protein YcdF (DUF218 family)
MYFATCKRHLLLLALSIYLLQACSFSSKTTQQLFAKAKTESYDMVVVPGVPFEDSIWSRTMKGRVYWSKYLYDQGIAKNIMYSGGAVYTAYCEAEIMALYAEAVGIPKEHIFIETKAEHSTENIYYSYKKARKLGFKKIALASDPFQTKQLRRYVRKKVNPGVALIPFVVDTLKVLEPGFIDPVIEYEKVATGNFVPLKQREGFWKRLWGTLGKNIDYSLYE